MEEKASLNFRKMDLNKILYFSLLRFCREKQEEKEELLKITNYQNEGQCLIKNQENDKRNTNSRIG